MGLVMAGSVNKVILIGNLGRDPEVRRNNEGSIIVTLSLATSESWNDKSTGERRERTEWHRVVIFNDRLADVAEKYLKKGSKLYLEGQLQTRKWTGNDGQERYTTEVVLNRCRGELTMLDSRGGASSDSAIESQPPDSLSDGVEGQETNFSEDLDDEIPF